MNLIDWFKNLGKKNMDEETMGRLREYIDRMDALTGDVPISLETINKITKDLHSILD